MFERQDSSTRAIQVGSWAVGWRSPRLGPWEEAVRRLARHFPAADASAAVGWVEFGPMSSEGDGSGSTYERLEVPPATLRFHDRRVEVGAGGSEALVAVERSFAYAVAWLLAPQRGWLLHGAGVHAPPRRSERPTSILVTAPAGGGKSTVAAAAVEAGWTVLGDDMVVVTDASSGPQVCGVPRPLAVPPDLGGSTTGWPAIPGDPRGRRSLRVDATSAWTRVGAVAVVAHGQEIDTTVHLVPGTSLLRPLLDAHFAPQVADWLPRYLPVAATLSRLPTWQILLGVGAGRRLRSTAAALDQIASSSVGAST